jgi:hypothetical protein
VEAAAAAVLFHPLMAAPDCTSSQALHPPFGFVVDNRGRVISPYCAVLETE